MLSEYYVFNCLDRILWKEEKLFIARVTEFEIIKYYPKVKNIFSGAQKPILQGSEEGTSKAGAEAGQPV